MINIDYTSTSAIYEQVYAEIVRLILSKALKPDDKLPSVRELAAMTKINPNTIQKAYKALENDNYIYTVKGKGNFVKTNADLKKAHINKNQDALRDILKSMMDLGLEKDEIINLVKEVVDNL